MSKTTSIEVDLGDKELDFKLKTLLDSIPLETVKELLSVYYSRSAQQIINGREYSNLVTLEWISSLYAMLDDIG